MSGLALRPPDAFTPTYIMHDRAEAGPADFFQVLEKAGNKNKMLVNNDLCALFMSENRESDKVG